ncbi:MAG TPA: thioredoxin domain-containing protein [Rhizomicrobium sp.]|nr:thioredoxin domain-containing protein [Rhizomicrobium sp.]
MSRNLLDRETSPYLLLHKDNPVHWRPWGPQAFEEARAQNKPILLSVGYTACHWCHVMNQESFQDPDTAALMNDLFVNVKVDREERPDLDQLYQTAAAHMGHSGGWPLTMFLTPSGEPFLAGGYLPREERGELPAFRRALQTSAELYRDKPEQVANMNQQVLQSLNGVWNRNMRAAQGLPSDTLDHAAIRVGQRFDIFYGGVTGLLKFPSFQLTELLWRGYLRTASAPLQYLTQITLDGMCLGGIYDHVGGGISRYSVDERWLVPHFEKMLYDNAQFIDILTIVWQGNRNRHYAERVEETIDWLFREMRAGDAFASSLDAESEGQEGLYYTWTEAEVDAALAGTFTQKFKEAYHVTRDGNFNGRNILNRLGLPPYPQSDADEALFRKQRALLLEARMKRVPPMRDDKVLADCNGLIIAALANAGQAFRRKDWTEAAVRCFDFVVRNMSEGDRLWHSWRNGARGHMGFADDYAHMARAALALWEATSGEKYLQHAAQWSNLLNMMFWDNVNGGLFYTAADDEPLMLRSRSAIDNNLPSANGVMVAVMARLYLITGDQGWRDRSNALVQAFSSEIGRNYMAIGAFINGLEVVMHSLQIVIIGPRDHTGTHELVNAVLGRSLPTKTLLVMEPGQNLSQLHPAFGKTMQNGQPTAYICQHMTCGAPITNPVTLSQKLQLPKIVQTIPPPKGNA